MGGRGGEEERGEVGRGREKVENSEWFVGKREERVEGREFFDSWEFGGGGGNGEKKGGRQEIRVCRG